MILTMIGKVGVIVLWMLCVINIPTKKLRKRISPPWFDSKTRHLLNKKGTARRRGKRNLRSNNWETFRDLRLACKSLLSRKRKVNFQNLPKADSK